MGISKNWAQVPRNVKSFLLKGLVFFCAWKIVYVFFLLPTRVLDRPLSNSVAFGTAKLLGLLNPQHSFSINSATDTSLELNGKIATEKVVRICMQDKAVLAIADVCNALELFVLYAAFIICMPSPPARKLIFILGGMVLIFLLNILRCAGLGLIYLHYPQYMDFSHHYLFTTLVYGFIFFLWYIFAKNLTFNARSRQ